MGISPVSCVAGLEGCFSGSSAALAQSGEGGGHRNSLTFPQQSELGWLRWGNAPEEMVWTAKPARPEPLLLVPELLLILPLWLFLMQSRWQFSCWLWWGLCISTELIKKLFFRSSYTLLDTPDNSVMPSDLLMETTQNSRAIQQEILGFSSFSLFLFLPKSNWTLTCGFVLFFGAECTNPGYICHGMCRSTK